MNLKKFFLTTCLIGLLAGLTACQQVEKTVIRETNGTPAPTGLPDPSSQQQGGSDTGGGNGIGCGDNTKCGPLESFTEDIIQKPEFIQNLLPIIRKLAKIYKPLAADLMHIAHDRRWYFVPVELDKIPGRQIGVGFATDQLALHKKQEIWISTIYYEKMADQNKALLLLHELVMGVRLMSFQSSLDHCLADAASNLIDEGNEAEYRFARSVCMREPDSGIFDPRGISLDSEDHSNIRELTKMLMDSKQDLSSDEIKAWLKSHRFRDYKDL